MYITKNYTPNSLLKQIKKSLPAYCVSNNVQIGMYRSPAAGAQHVISNAPVVAKPTPAQDPRLAVVLDTRYFAGRTRTTIIGKDKRNFSTELRWDFVRVIQNVLSIPFAKMGIESFCSPDHRMTIDINWIYSLLNNRKQIKNPLAKSEFIWQSFLFGCACHCTSSLFIVRLFILTKNTPI